MSTNNNKALRYGVIGTGMMGVEHIENLNALEGAVVVAAADPYAPSRQAAIDAADQPIEVFETYPELIAADTERDLCDVWVVVTPNHTHAEVMSDLMVTEKPILLEKPMVTTMADAQELLSKASSYPSPIWIGLEYRYMAPVQAMLNELRAGAIGTIRMIAIREHRFPFLIKVGDWNRFSANTGGTLVEKCCHFFDLMNLMAESRPVRVMASGGQDVNHLDETYDGQQSDILDNAFVIVEYENGVRASLDLSMFAEASHNQEEISVVGDKGKIEALIPENLIRIGIRGEHCLGSVKQERVISDSPYAGHHHGSSYVEHQRFASAIRTGSEPEITVRDGLWSIAVGVAAHRSIDEGRVVTVDEVFNDGPTPAD